MSTLTYLLIALAVSDILAPQANALLGFSFYHLSSKYGNSVTFLKFENILRYIIHPLSTMFTMSSSWIVTLTTLFRLIAVKYPFTARTLINKRKAVFSLIFIFGFSLVSISPLYYKLLLVKRLTPDQKYYYLAFEMKDFSEFMKKAYTPIMQTMCFYLPWTLSLVFGIILIKSLKSSFKSFGMPFSSSQFSISLTNNNGSTQTRPDLSCYYMHGQSSITESRMNNVHVRHKSSNKVTLMVTVLCFTNLICRIFTFSFCFEIFFNEFYPFLKKSNVKQPIVIIPEFFNMTSELEEETKQTIFQSSSKNANAKTHFPLFFSYSLLFNNIFLCIDHSVNIFIYYYTNPRFKKDLLKFFKINTP
jgi:hypothetical protein